MRGLRRFAAILALLLPIATVVSVASSSAASTGSPNRQPWFTYVSDRWDATTHPYAVWYVAPSLALQGPDYPERAFNAANAWTTLEGGFEFLYGGTTGSTAAQEQANWDRNRDGGGCTMDYTTNSTPNEIQASTDLGPAAGPNTVAVTRQCQNFGGGHTIWGFTIRVGIRGDWFTSSDSAVPSNKIDLWGALTHELGHGLGWAGTHYNACLGGIWSNEVTCNGASTTEPTDICNADVGDRGSMCSVAVIFGRAVSRNPSADDRIVFYSAYPKKASPPGGGGPDVCRPLGTAPTASTSSIDGATPSGTPVVIC